ncbi:FkbM family methyltransferase [Brevibacillus sp. B_LB10_24]|uniref:FkbM family methyltransferase n=1 Tax=Brevibacillus sp. B_LB10_24 TaxID=3380645 RepID=UPI0038BC8694
MGANVGNRTGVFLQLGARVVAVEPQTDCGQNLWGQFGTHPHFTLIQKALGAKEGQAEMYLSEWNVLSSLSPEWIHHTRSSGRFASIAWNRQTVVDVTTLDSLIGQFGLPTFCKIDVEGYEYQVIQGLTKPIPALSFEFTREHLQPTIDCVQYLATLGAYRFNLSSGESMQFDVSNWMEPTEFLSRLESLLPHPLAWGDVYARLEQAE